MQPIDIAGGQGHSPFWGKKWEKLLTPEIVARQTQIHEYKGEQSLFVKAKADAFTRLVDIAKIQSTEASNKIEGIRGLIGYSKVRHREKCS